MAQDFIHANNIEHDIEQRKVVIMYRMAHLLSYSRITIGLPRSIVESLLPKHPFLVPPHRSTVKPRISMIGF